MNLLLLVLALSPMQAGAQVSADRQQELEYLLRQDCGSCHGMTLKGGLGPSLRPEAIAGKPRELLVSTILYGRAGTPMPPWRQFLSEQEARWLVDALLRGDDGAR